MAYNIPGYTTDNFSFGPGILKIGAFGTNPGDTPSNRGPIKSNLDMQTLLCQGSLNSQEQGNPEGWESRDSKPCRDFSVEELKSKYGTFQMLIDCEDTDVISVGLRVSKQRVKSGYCHYVPTASKNGKNRCNNDCRFVHILVVEKVLGRTLRRDEVVHHINANPFDCRRENLLVCKPNEHTRLHTKMSALYAKIFFGSSTVDDQPSLEELLDRKTQRIRGIRMVI